MRRLLRVVRTEAGYSMTELLVVMVILGTVLAGLTTAFVGGSKAEVDLNRRVQAQIQAAGAFDRLRRDVHCASSATISGATMTLSGCSSSGPVAWSAAASSSCTATGYTLYALSRTFNSFTKQYADCLTSSSIFTYVAPVAGASLAKVHAVITASVNPAKSVETFALQDDIVMRNSARA
ncbi:MAG TPA: type II secretion system protein [Gaiellaceae bacterium]|jgi:prepilin-type N-terminal cleavage/methylation domain-containing protein